MSEPVTAATTVTACPSCGAEVVAGERFCESCGADVTAAAPVAVVPEDPADPVASVPPAAAAPLGEPHDGTLLDDATAAATDMARRAWVAVTDADLDTRPATCANCSGTIADDGYCEQCGMAAPKVRDHFVEQPAPWVVGVCDRGLRHSRNEDAMALGAAQQPGSFAALVVCDGVTNATDSDVASLAAARAARDMLVEGVREPVAATTPAEGTGGQTARAAALVKRMVDAGAAAQERAAASAAQVGVGEGKSPPSCTFVAAVLERPPGADQYALVVGCVGDSRAYWVPDAGAARQLSVDDSWAAEAIAQGIPREQAEHMPQSHAITRWLGVDAPDPVPTTSVHAISEPGWLLVCSDGLWNYCSEAEDVAQVLQRSGSSDPLTVAEAMTAWANEQGGHDNISVTLARIA